MGALTGDKLAFSLLSRLSDGAADGASISLSPGKETPVEEVGVGVVGTDGEDDGVEVGSCEGTPEGVPDGAREGTGDGPIDGCGDRDGPRDGLADGVLVGFPSAV